MENPSLEHTELIPWSGPSNDLTEFMEFGLPSGRLVSSLSSYITWTGPIAELMLVSYELGPAIEDDMSGPQPGWYLLVSSKPMAEKEVRRFLAASGQPGGIWLGHSLCRAVGHVGIETSGAQNMALLEGRLSFVQTLFALRQFIAENGPIACIQPVSEVSEEGMHTFIFVATQPMKLRDVARYLALSKPKYPWTIRFALQVPNR